MIVVYALLKRNKVVYVGRSKNLRKRVLEHKREKDFDSHFIICELKTMEGACAAEDFFIRKYDPLYNKALNKEGSYMTVSCYSKKNKINRFNLSEWLAALYLTPVFNNNYRFTDLDHARIHLEHCGNYSNHKKRYSRNDLSEVKKWGVHFE